MQTRIILSESPRTIAFGDGRTHAVIRVWAKRTRLTKEEYRELRDDGLITVIRRERYRHTHPTAGGEGWLFVTVAPS